MNFQEKVKLFQIASGQPVHLKRELTKEELDFRDSLLREEIREFNEAVVDNKRVKILDALCDIKYVNDGTANMMCVEQDDIFLKEDLIIYRGDLQENIDSLNNLETKMVDNINKVVFNLVENFCFSFDVFEKALNRVHESNMSKFCNDIHTAERTKKFYADQGIETYIEPKEKKFVIFREIDGKVLKSCEYHPVYLDDLV